MMRLEFVTLAGVKLSEDVYEVMLPTLDGTIAVYAQHTPLVTVVAPGVISVRRSKTQSPAEADHYAAFGGVAEITGKALKILVDEAAHADDIIEQEAAEALERAKAMKAQASTEVELEKAQALIDRERVRLQVASLRRHRR